MKKFILGLIGIFLLGTSLVDLTPATQAWGIETRSIIGTDDRIPVTDTTIAPYQSTVFIAANGSYGSGSVIGKNTVLTAAHVVKRIKDDPNKDSIFVAPGRDGATLPYGKFKIKEVHIPQKYLTTPNVDSDIAVVTLEQNNGQSIGDVVKQNPIALTDSVTIGSSLSSLGYPGDKPWATMWETKGKITDQSATRLYYDFDTSGGQSGSSVFNNNHEIIAVHSSGATTVNIGLKLTSEYYDFILEHIGETSTPIEISPKDIVVEKEVVELDAGESIALKASVLPENTTNKQLQWDTTDEEIVTVDANGRITGVNPGSTIIDVTTADGKITKYIDVTVNEVAPKEIVVEKEYLELTTGESTTLKASVLPENTTYKQLFWLSSDDTIATVDDNGKITGVTAGSAEILILSSDGKIEKYITVKINEALQPINMTFPSKTGLYFSNQDIKETVEVPSTADKKAIILFHLNKLNPLYELKIGEMNVASGTGVYNVKPLTLGQPMIPSLYDVSMDRKLTDSDIVIMYVDKKKPNLVKDYFFVRKM
ncbi:hypothetical protein DOK67_0001407 [Enterococcus sp. DIV0212c]|uniref:Ig-like domain-containing protein n=1 Tax=Enterococcus sp. DIV0212c TaxID=2230867 RepID=UPI001A9B709F|nr:Ig-like domain-containing protein [Enterococcus sp. DIV0212c]MBO1355104.1 Ig-like domain-containing protein [Enterococcus sp. DIV0212c]